MRLVYLNSGMLFLNSLSKDAENNFVNFLTEKDYMKMDDDDIIDDAILSLL